MIYRQNLSHLTGAQTLLGAKISRTKQRLALKQCLRLKDLKNLWYYIKWTLLTTYHGSKNYINQVLVTVVAKLFSQFTTKTGYYTNQGDNGKCITFILTILSHSKGLVLWWHTEQVWKSFRIFRHLCLRQHYSDIEI